LENLGKINYLENIRVDLGTILICALKKLDWLGMGIGDDEEPSGSIKGGKFLDQLSFASQERFNSMEFYLTMALQPLWA
jgi:hypothetical protein